MLICSQTGVFFSRLTLIACMKRARRIYFWNAIVNLCIWRINSIMFNQDINNLNFLTTPDKREHNLDINLLAAALGILRRVVSNLYANCMLVDCGHSPENITLDAGQRKRLSALTVIYRPYTGLNPPAYTTCLSIHTVVFELCFSPKSCVFRRRM